MMHFVRCAVVNYQLIRANASPPSRLRSALLAVEIHIRTNRQGVSR